MCATCVLDGHRFEYELSVVDDEGIEEEAGEETEEEVEREDGQLAVISHHKSV